MPEISASFWQHSDWNHFREKCGETVFEFSAQDAHAIVIEKAPHFLKFWKKKIWELQRGPVGNSEYFPALFQKIFTAAKKHNIERVRVYPPMGIFDFWKKILPLSHDVFFGVSPKNAPEIFPEHTLFLDLSFSEDEILAQMKQGGRRNIRKAIKANIEIFPEKNIENFWKILQQTAKRDGFTTNKKHFYQAMFDTYCDSKNPEKKGVLLSARDETGEVLASKFFLVSGKMGIYYYGASSNQKRNLMAPYLLQWEGIQWAKKNGATQYDFLGIAPENSDNHQLSSVSQFKLRFGGERIISDRGIDFWL